MSRVTWVLGEDFEFPPHSRATSEGVLAVGGTVTPRSLRRAYRYGVFPWPVGPHLPILWFSPAERMVLDPRAVRVSRSLGKVLDRGRFEVRWSTAFEDVMRACATPRYPGDGTWIDRRLVTAYVALQREAPLQNVVAHSVETWRDGQLVGGLYGVAVGGVFCGESMFHRESDASKVALVTLCRRMVERGFSLVDCQVHTPHLESMGAVIVPRREFLRSLGENVDTQLTLA